MRVTEEFIMKKMYSKQIAIILLFGLMAHSACFGADVNVSTSIQPSYGEGDGVLEITIDGVTTQIHYQNQFGEGGSGSMEETYNTPIGAIKVNVNYPTSPLSPEIDNSDTIDNVTGIFGYFGDYAIHNSGDINTISDSYFTHYYITDSESSVILNDAGANIGKIINSYFIDNEDVGAVYIVDDNLTHEISDSLFMSNYSTYVGGSFYNGENSTIEKMNNVSFVGNESEDYGGAIYNGGVINEISNSKFVGNKAYHGGGAISNYGSNASYIANINNSYFMGNKSDDAGGAIYAGSGGKLGDISNSTFIGNYGNTGGAIHVDTTLNSVTESTFLSNSTKYGGGALYVNGNLTEGISDSVFAGNTASNGGAVYYASERRNKFGGISNTVFEANSAVNNGGAIMDYGFADATVGDITNSTFINNKAGVNGGAIYAVKNVSIVSDNGTTVISGNTAGDDDNAIYLAKASNVLTFNIKNGGETYMYDNVRGADGYTVNITGDDKETATMYLYNDLHNANVKANNVALNTINDDIHVYEFKSFTLDNDINMSVDADLAAGSMDRIESDNVTTNDHKINVVGINLLSDSEDQTTSILFADNNLKDSVENKVSQIGKDSNNVNQTVAYAPIYKYDVKYDKTGSEGLFVFERSGGGSSDDYNPSVLAQPVALQANVAQVNSIINNYAFHSVDTAYTNRLSSRYNNRYALAETVPTDLNTNNPLFVEPQEGGVWFKPFVTFENIPLKNGPKVNSINYGALIGYDSHPIYMKNGFDGVITGYVGYTGSTMHYSGIDEYTNGGLLGGTYSLYKGNFFNATTVMVGAQGSQANTQYGKDNIGSLYTAVGNKTGYNFEFKDGLFVLQPSMLISYTFANTFDYTNSAGVKMHSKPINSIQLSPGLKFYMNLRHGWRPYVGVNMMWNLMDSTNVTANNVKLPSMSIKPYVEYGLGVQKDMTDNFSAYFQAMMHNGGRNGIALTGGMKYLFSNVR